MNRIEEAEDVVYRTLSGKYGDFGHQEEVVRALDADGHLLPDLPEPEENDHYGSDVWSVRTPHEHVGVRQNMGRIQSSIVGTYGPEEAREAAYALLAAADHAERPQN